MIRTACSTCCGSRRIRGRSAARPRRRAPVDLHVGGGASHGRRLRRRNRLRRGHAGDIPPGAAVDQAAAGLARTVVTMLRRRIADGTDAGEEVGERVGAAYREWRGERIERLVGDFAVQAFSAGVAEATPAGGLVRWVLTSVERLLGL